MRSSTAARTRLPGAVLVVVLLTGSILGPSPVSTAGEPDPVGVWPLSPAPSVVQRFDPPSSPWGAGHRGVDLLGHVGQTVGSALPGRVTFAGMLAGRGVVVVDHGETRTSYEPVAATAHVGDLVSAGGPLGSLTPDLSHCPPAACLHWGWIRNVDDVYLDPLLLVGAGPVRLLPLWGDRPGGSGPIAPRSVSPYAGWRPLVEVVSFSPAS
ncbi:Peptidase family M23 [Nocardioides terrae]|uniref:Peptidase family M23 n=1 Tax=Nocardioides terrae TaxID=574651 RepID=A0A1I1JBH3_9ACTN|nr:M23 family metallopeptidase [Nocardioides terrae]SFC43948.1 Peptidase family M23 [Nocardioides terrae]